MTTRAARLTAHDAPLSVETVELPAPAEGEVLVELTYAGINPVDRYGAVGLVAADGPLPRTLGAEAVGLLDGRPVFVGGAGLGSQRDGLWAQHAVVPRSAVTPVPPGVDLQQAACVGVAGLTAWAAVADLGQVCPEERVLVLGASGGVGLAVVAMAARRGAEVWAQTGSAAKADALRDAGAAHVVVCDADGLADAVGDASLHVVIDPLGGPFTPAALGLVRPLGRYVVFGTTAGAEVTLDLQSVYRRSIKVLGYSGFQLTEKQRADRVHQVLQAMARTEMLVPVDRVLPLDDVQSAFGLLTDRAVTGKIVLDLR